MQTSTLLTLAGLITLGTAGYVLEDDYSASSFFNMFEFFTSADPTHGFVDYVDQGTAQGGGLINTDNGVVYIGVDYKNTAGSNGRQSVRLTSSKSYTHGLIILDLAHMPGGVCGTWPAFWMVGASWPSNGEIDIIEGVNSQSQNDMTLHSSSGCSIQNSGSGTLVTSNCDVNAPNQATNAGCQIAASSSAASYGTGFNSAGGGVYATEWTSQGISIYFFPRGSVPSDIASGNPDPSSWGKPAASFGGCNFDSYFKEQQIVFDTTFCGDWAGAVWGTDSICAAKAGTCQDYVRNHPGDFQEAYWSVNSLKVYSDSGNSANAANRVASPSPSSIIAPVSTPISSASVAVPATSTAALGSSSPQETGGPSTPAQVTVPNSKVIQEPTSTAQTTLATQGTQTSSANVNYVTVSAMTFDDFPKQKQKRERHAKHLLRHAKKGL